MTRREILAAGALTLVRPTLPSPRIYPWGRYYELPGSSGPRIAVLGEPPANPRPTLMLFRSAAQSVEGLGLALASTALAQLMLAEGWTICGVDLPCESGCDRWPGEPPQIPGIAHRLANGRSLWSGASGQSGVRQRASNGLDMLASAGYVDLARVFAAGLSRGFPFAAGCAEYDQRIRGLVGLHPVTEWLALEEFTGHPLPELCAAEDVRLMAPALAHLPLWGSVNISDSRVNSLAAVRAVMAFAESGTPVEEPDPRVTLRIPSVAGHASPDYVYAEARDWLLAREPG